MKWHRNRSNNLVLGFGSETLLVVIMTSTNRYAIQQPSPDSVGS
jgi:hypothetical protein